MNIEEDDVPADIAELTAEMRSGFADMRAEMRGGLADMRGEMHSGLADMRAEMHSGFAELRGGFAELRGGLAELRADHLDFRVTVSGALLAVNTSIDGLRQRVETLTDSLADFRREYAGHTHPPVDDD